MSGCMVFHSLASYTLHNIILAVNLSYNIIL